MTPSLANFLYSLLVGRWANRDSRNDRPDLYQPKRQNQAHLKNLRVSKSGVTSQFWARATSGISPSPETSDRSNCEGKTFG